MRAVVVIAALLFLAASLAAQGPAAAASSTKGSLSRKEIKHLRKVKKQALRFGDSERLCVRLADRSQAEGQLMKVTTEGIQLGVWFSKCGKHKALESSQDHSSRFISFGQIQSIKFSERDQWAPFLLGMTAGCLGPLGWLEEWAILTGRD